MSETETWYGKIKLIFTGDKNNIENKCKELCESFEYEFESWHESYKECLNENSDKFLVIDKDIYEIDHKNRIRNDSFCNITKIESDVYEFTASFYNGGICLSEMIEDSIKQLNKKE